MKETTACWKINKDNYGQKQPSEDSNSKLFFLILAKSLIIEHGKPG